MKEIWKDIPGYDGWYQISNHGRVRSWKRPPKGRLESPAMRTPDVNHQGYHRIALSKKAQKKKFSIHRLVAEAFIPNPDNKPFINHKDCNRGNNHVKNLEWCTQEENIQHAIKNDRLDTPMGERHYASKLTKSDVIQIKKLCKYSELTQSEIAEQFQIDPSHVSDLKKGKRWKHVTI